jgi:hypothetical protein
LGGFCAGPGYSRNPRRWLKYSSQYRCHPAGYPTVLSPLLDRMGKALQKADEEAYKSSPQNEAGGTTCRRQSLLSGAAAQQRKSFQPPSTATKPQAGRWQRNMIKPDLEEVVAVGWSIGNPSTAQKRPVSTVCNQKNSRFTQKMLGKQEVEFS